jgi:hypothetical protein
MKPSINGDSFATTVIIKIAALLTVAITFFYIGKHWSINNQQLIFFTTTTTISDQVTTSPNFNKFSNISDIINHNQTLKTSEPLKIKKLGVLNEDGTMSNEFEIGEFDPDFVDDSVNKTQVDDSNDELKFEVKKFALCSSNMSDYIPCLDNAEAIGKLESVAKGERFERHCPVEEKRFNCLIPPPKGYRSPIPWPKSRDEVHC